MLAKARPLGLDRVDELDLLCRPGGKSEVEWAEVPEVATAHLGDLLVSHGDGRAPRADRASAASRDGGYSLAPVVRIDQIA